MTVGLAMLVKDEAATLAATLERIRPVIDRWTVIDTGSTDDTAEVARDALDGIPGLLINRPWRNFGHNRTELLREAQGTADYHLMLDADHVLHVDGEQPVMDADSYLVRVRGEMEWRLPLLTRDGHPFEYRGVAHSYLASDQPTRSVATDWLSIDGGPGADRAKLERDRVLLEQAFLDSPDDARTVFYLAQTYRDLDLHDQAIRFYRMRAHMDGFDEETYFARFQLGVLLSERVSFAQGAPELLAAWLLRPSRTESLRALANAATCVADKTPLPDDKLFVTGGGYGG